MLLRHQCVRACYCVCSARALRCRSRVLLRRQCVRAAASAVRGCCCCVGRARSVRACVLLSRSTPGPFCRIGTFIPRGLETMVGLNPYHVVALRRRFGRPLRSPKARFIDFGRLYPGGGKQWSAPTPTLLWRCDVGPVGARSVRSVCCLSRVQSARACCCVVCARCCDTSACVRAAVPCARAAATPVRACVLLCRARVLLRLQCACAAVSFARAAAPAVRACCCVGAWVLLLRRPCAVCPCVRAAVSVDPWPVLSDPDVYTPGVGNNGRPQPLPCRGTAPSVRPAATVARGPFHRFRTFIPRRWETMVGTNPYIVVALRRRSGRCTVCPCCLLPVPCAVCAFVLLCSVCTLLRHQCVRACCCAVRACCCVCSARVLLCRSRVLLRLQCVLAAANVLLRLQCVLAAAWVRGCCCCVGRARSVRACVLLSRSTPGPFCRIRTFIPRGLETMVGLNPYHVVALRRRFGRPLRSPEARFIDFGRLYPGGGKQWSAPTPTLLWRCDVGPVGARSVRAVCCLSRVQSARACCFVVCARCCDTSACVRAAVPCARAAASAVRVCCCVVRACCCACSACLLLRGCCCCVGRARSVRACVLLSRSTPGPFCRIRTFIPRGLETMVGLNPYHVVALRRRFGRPLRSPEARFIDFGRLYPGGGKQWSAPTPTLLWRCDVGPVGARSVRAVCCLSRVQSARACCCVVCARCCDTSACVRAAVPCARAAASAVRVCCCVVRACCCACSACLLLRGCCCCVGRARSVRACVLLSRSTPGPFCRIRTFIPRGLETMVGLNPYHVVALRRRFGRPLRSPEDRFIDFGRLYPGGGKQWSAPTPTLLWRCDVGPVGARSVRAVCCLSRVQSARSCCCVVCARCCDTSACVRAAVPCARAAASAARVCCCVVRACCCACSACLLLRTCCCACSACLLLRGCVGAAAASAVRGLSVRACCCLGRPPARFVESGRLYPGGWKQWSASTPTMSWHCAVGSAGRYGRPRPVSSISDVYTQEVGNNGRHQPLHCCGVATSVRSVHGLSVLSAACPVCSLRVRAAL
ncbi:hypothetical protein MRB53_036490 [Persea americana]|nr:hypothetical protein MRB53_036490 [Persea americana]